MNIPMAFFLQPLVADIGLSLLQLLLFFSSIWLIFLILIQRGKGGGLTAAFGGGGGDSAFGAKAGDAFTRITIVSALVWITLCMVTIARYNPPEQAQNPYAVNEEEGPSLGSGGTVTSEDPESEGETGDTSEGETEDTPGGASEGQPDSETDAAVTGSADSTPPDESAGESADGESDQ